MRRHWGLLALAAPLAIPWTVQVLPGELFLVFPWGLASTRAPSVLTLDAYLFERTAGVAGLPRRLLAWPIGTVVYACALGLAVGGSVDVGGSEWLPVPGWVSAPDWLSILRPDPFRWVSILLALAALVHLRVTLGVVALGSIAVPTGPAVLLVAAWWVAGWPRPRPVGDRPAGDGDDDGL